MKKKQKKQLHYETLEDSQNVLRFSPYAWSKLLYFRDKGETEVGGFAITEEGDLLMVTDFITVRQEATVASISFDDESVADYIDSQIDQGRNIQQVLRIWLHTHPGHSPVPSSVDEETFMRVFGQCQWAVMFIIAESGQVYARMDCNVGPGVSIELEVEVDYSCSFGGSDIDAWDDEYDENVHELCLRAKSIKAAASDDYIESDFWDEYDIVREIEDMDASDRSRLMNELSERPELWSEVAQEDYYE